MNRIPLPRLLLLALLPMLFAACDSGVSANEDEALAPGRFAATMNAPAMSADLSGVAAASLQATDEEFGGVFRSYAIGTDETGRSFFFSTIRLRAESGEELILGYISPDERLESGTYAIESGRNLTAPFDFVSVLTAPNADLRSGNALAQRGSVTLTVSGGEVTGSFDIDYEGNLNVAGQFAAVPE
ncbi:MAG: hypothetical protein AAGI71_18305 [Bacteroidota bacterium]